MFDAWMQVSEDQLSGGIKTKNKNVNDLLNSLSMKIISEIPVIRSQITWWDALTSSIADVGPASLEIMWRNIKINYPHFAATTTKLHFSRSTALLFKQISALHTRLSIAIRINFVFLFMKNEPVIREIQLYRTIL